jgi:hypothetical protein
MIFLKIPTPVFMKILKTFSPIKDKIKFMKYNPEIPGLTYEFNIRRNCLELNTKIDEKFTPKKIKYSLMNISGKLSGKNKKKSTKKILKHLKNFK